jgi:hypothetical protein
MKTANLYLGILTGMMACTSPKSEETHQTKKEENLTISMSEDEKKSGFRALFDGKDVSNWHTYHSDSVKWMIEDGVLHTKGGNHDLVSNEEFEDFDLKWDWKVGKSGNSGMIYMVQDKKEIEETYMTGIEYQMIDHLNWPDKLMDVQKPGAVYDLYPPLKDNAKSFGEWNSAEVIAKNGLVKHFLNNELVAEYTWNSKDYLEKFGKSL